MAIENPAERLSIAEMLARLAEPPLPGAIEARDVEQSPEREGLSRTPSPGPDEA